MNKRFSICFVLSRRLFLSRKRSRGFTLLEVMVAVSILAITLGAIIHRASAMTENATKLQNMTFAHWIAMNKLTELRLENGWPSVGTDKGDTEMVGKKWGWIVITSDTPNKQIRKVSVEVYETESRKEGEMVTELTGYLVDPSAVSQFTK